MGYSNFACSTAKAVVSVAQFIATLPTTTPVVSTQATTEGLPGWVSTNLTGVSLPGAQSGPIAVAPASTTTSATSGGLLLRGIHHENSRTCKLRLLSNHCSSVKMTQSSSSCPGAGHLLSNNALHLALLFTFGVFPIACSNSSSSTLLPFEFASATVLTCPNSAGGT